MANTLVTNTSSKYELRLLICVLLILAAFYFPFVNKAFNVDDTLFIKAAEQILITPFDFYGGEVNWYGVPAPHFIINKNPPFVSYLIAAVASVFGFNEIALHSFFFLSVALSAIGIYLLSRQFKTSPTLATALAVFTPVFLIHGTNLMSDSTMMMFWVWGLVFWFTGIRKDAPKWFFLAGFSVAFGILTKYTCVFLLPLMVFSGIWHYRRPGLWIFAVLIPLVTLVAFEIHTQILYGKGLFSDAFVYANESTPKALVDYFDNTLIGLSFLGGCFPVALLLVPLIGNVLLRIAVSVFTLGIALLIYSQGSIGGHSFMSDGGIDPGLAFQFCAFSLAGVCLVIACLKEISRRANHDSIFILLWFFGILVFVFYLNWTINARSFILLVPVTGILLSRRLEEWRQHQGHLRSKVSYALLGVAALLAVGTTYADFVWAGTARVAAKEITSKYNKLGKVWFQGHWGFQYYMEKRGASPMNFRGNDIQPGDFVIIPVNNTNLAQLNYQYGLVEVMEFSHRSFLATMSPNRDSGFYASVWGAMPYVVEKPSNERYLIFRRTN